MFVTRDVMHCKPGKVGEMVAKFKAMSKLMKEMGSVRDSRIMTDVAGSRYWTVVFEQQVENLDAHQAEVQKLMADPRVQQIMQGYHDLVDWGSREFYKLEE